MKFEKVEIFQKKLPKFCYKTLAIPRISYICANGINDVLMVEEFSSSNTKIQKIFLITKNKRKSPILASMRL